MNLLAILAGLVVYIVFALPLGLGALGLGFSPEPQKMIGSYVILLAPLLPSGFVVAYLARKYQLVLAATVGLIAVIMFWVLAPGPMPWIMVEQNSAVAIAAQASYHAFLYVVVVIFGGWVAMVIKQRRGI